MNEAICRRVQASIAYHRENPNQIPRRLQELDEEWDIERALAAGSSVLTLFGLAMTLTRGRKWLLLPIAVQGFCLQRALQGCCAPFSLLRRLGFRTQTEIHRERSALQDLRRESQEQEEGRSKKRGGDIVEVTHPS